LDNPLFESLNVSTSGLQAQSTRLRVIAENIANAGATGAGPGEAPYRRKTITFELVGVKKVGRDPSEFRMAYEPGHPAADEQGYVRRSNVNTLIEMVDMREASRSYEANLKSLEMSRDMLGAALDLLR
jgi:flagellar basal-body rod protein FlgC